MSSRRSSAQRSASSAVAMAGASSPGAESAPSGGVDTGPASSASASLREEWRTVPGLDARYEVSDQGRVRSWVGWRGEGRRASPRLMNPKIHWTHKVVRVAGETRYVHHLILLAFVGPRPDGQVGRHLNDIPDDNRLENLAWGTRAQNVEDGKRNGRNYGRAGEAHRMAKLIDEKVRAIRAWRSYGFMGKEIGEWYSIHPAMVYAIANRKRWGHVE